MNKLGLVGLMMVMGLGCFRGLDFDGAPHLEDAWAAPGLQELYAEGSIVPLEIRSPDRPLEDYEVQSLDPDVLVIRGSGEFLEAEAVGLGEATVVVLERGEEIERHNVRVTVPNRMEITLEREDFSSSLNTVEIPVADSIAMRAGGTTDVHVRYFEDGERIYGGSVLFVEGEMPSTVASWSPEGNIIRLAPDAAGTYDISFRVGGFSQSIVIDVAEVAAGLELTEGSPDELLLLTDGSGAVGDQVIQPIARDAEGRILRGTLPIVWTIDLGDGPIELGEGTLMGVLTNQFSDDVRPDESYPVTAVLDGWTATFTARGSDVFLAR